MSRDSDWHVFDKACDITAMALRGSADDVTPESAASLFTAIYSALRETATTIDEGGQRTGF
jgi:hypothetical protein